MGVVSSKDFFAFGRHKVDEACSNTSLSKLRYIAIEKPKWKVFGKREFKPITSYPVKGRKGCACGANGPCKQKITPKGVVLHYPQRNRLFEKKYKPPKLEKSYLTDKDRVVNNVKIVRPKKFGVPTFRMDKLVTISPFQTKIQNSILKRRRRRETPPVAKKLLNNIVFYESTLH
ncbi:hypothetical protein NE865_11072 [Phthorimaea operculella]|nr:hypothetical protein NE865_11072 [Phthorimaea operculella]